MRIFNDHPFPLNSEQQGPFASFAFADETERKSAIERADSMADFEIPAIPASLYMEYAVNGNRTNCEKPYFDRRTALCSLLFGCLAEESRTERYLPKMIDLIWAICEETTWVIPAHNVAKPYRLAGEPLPDAFGDDIIEVDIFAAETASILSWVYHFKKEALDAVTPVICRRIEFEMHRRILKPYRRLEMRWMTNFINNWTPWIISNVLTAAAIFIEEPHERHFIISVSMGYLDRFVMTYGEDGGCNEGASYWTAAVAALFDCICILRDITGGALDVTDHPFLKKMCEYFPDLTISPADMLVANFADCGRHVNADARLIRRMGEMTGSEKLLRFASSLPTPETKPFRQHIYRQLCNAMTPAPAPIVWQSADDTAVYPDLQVAVLRRGAYYLAVKGGHNRESHNHNDLGSFLLYHGTDPILIDAGVGVYSKDTFSENRYKIWTMQSSYHNLPEIDGMMQLPGREYHADSFRAEGDSVQISYRSAYPAELSATSAERRFTLNDKALTILDEIKGASRVTFHLMLAEKPTPCEGGFLVGPCKVCFEGNYTVDEIDITYDVNLTAGWKRPSLFRVCIETAGTLVTTVTEA